MALASDPTSRPMPRRCPCPPARESAAWGHTTSRAITTRAASPSYRCSPWLYHEQNLVRPNFAADLLAARTHPRFEVLRPGAPPIPRWIGAPLFATCRLRDSIVAAGGPNGIFDTMASRGPDHPDWYKGGLYHDNEDFHVPALWVNAWYDLSAAPNIELFNHVRNKASDERIRDSQLSHRGTNGTLPHVPPARPARCRRPATWAACTLAWTTPCTLSSTAT